MARFLIIDDEKMVRSTLRKILEKNDHQVLEAHNGREGLQIYGDNQDIDIVITDIIMPEVEGIQVIMELRKRKPDQKILAISGGGRTKNQDYLKAATQLGANATLAKPFSVKDVVATVQKCLAQ
jgi:YesN/AraC family two-component response regulator